MYNESLHAEGRSKNVKHNVSEFWENKFLRSFQLCRTSLFHIVEQIVNWRHKKRLFLLSSTLRCCMHVVLPAQLNAPFVSGLFSIRAAVCWAFPNMCSTDSSGF